jgi:hypothetical protein
VIEKDALHHQWVESIPCCFPFLTRMPAPGILAAGFFIHQQHTLHPNHHFMAIKVGIIGAGGMLQYHAAGFRQAGAEIVAVADAAPGAAKRAAEKVWHREVL